MLTNYIRTALRNFSRNRLIFTINLFGLAIGLATCLVSGLYLKHEYLTDQFHRDINSIYRIQTQFKTWSFSGTPYLLAESLQHDFADVTNGLRTTDRKMTLRIGEDDFNHEVILSDPEFFSFFTFPLQRGNPQRVLNSLHQVVISEAISKKYFAIEEPVGKIIQLKLKDQFVDFLVTGVAAPLPSYSSIRFDFVIPLENHYANTDRRKDDWESLFLTTFVKIEKQKLSGVLAAMPAFIKTYVTGENSASTSFPLKPFAKHHLTAGIGGGSLKEGRDASGLYVFAGIALLILLLACFNFMNLANAQSSRRTIEVGIRKVVGAARLQLMRQFLVESLVMATLASVLALGLAELGLFMFQDILQSSLSVFGKEHLDIYLGLIVVTMFTGILAGTYPAIVLSNIKTLNTFKRHLRIGGNNWLTRGVLSIQFVLTIILIICALIMWRQQDFMLHKDLGYNQEQILALQIPAADHQSIQLLQNALKQLPEVVNAAKSTGSFTRGNRASLVRMSDDSRAIVFTETIDPDYLQTMQMQIVAGEGFSAAKTYEASTVIVNEAYIKKFDLQDSVGIPLGRTLAVRRPTILGVVKDFHNTSLHSAIEPFMFSPWIGPAEGESFLIIRLHAGEIAPGLKGIEALWSRTNPNSPFEFFFLDDDIARQYQAELRWSGIISLFTAIAIFLSVLGLVGLAIFTAEQRKKEIGIRKVLGASLQNIIGLLSRNYLMLISAMFILAVPLSYYLMTNYWLNTFIYHIEIDFIIYLLAFVLVFLVVGLAVGGLTVRAALQNPAETLKEE